MPNPRCGATEPKSIVERPDEAWSNAWRLSMCSITDCAVALGAKRRTKEKTTPHHATLMRGMNGMSQLLVNSRCTYSFRCKSYLTKYRRTKYRFEAFRF